MIDGPVLGLDATAAHCAAAVVSGGSVLASFDEPMARGQAERLAPMLAETLAAAGIGARDLAGVAVCTGPGNFTGARIGVAAARGLALAIGRPALGVTRMEALAFAAGSGPRLAVTAAAKRGEVFAQVFDLSDGEAPAAASELLQGTPEALAEALAALGPGRVCGPGAEVLAAALRIEAGAAGDFADACAVARLGAMRLAALGPGEKAERPAPVYLRPADAAPSSETPPAIIG